MMGARKAGGRKYAQREAIMEAMKWTGRPGCRLILPVHGGGVKLPPCLIAAMNY